MSKFEVGEIAIISNARAHPEHIGRECEIIELGPIYTLNGPIREYLISVDGTHFGTDGRDLRKKKPPEEQATWEAIEEKTGWSPLRQKEAL